MIAASKNYLDILKLILKSGALLEIRNSVWQSDAPPPHLSAEWQDRSSLGGRESA